MNIEEQLREAFAPCEPGPGAEAAVMAYVFGGVRRAPRGKPSRRVLLGAILFVAAAAAALLLNIARPPAPAAALVTPSASPVAEVAEAAAPQGSAVEPQLVETVAPAEPVAAVMPFTVQLMPLVDEATEPSVIAAIQAVYATFVERLRGVPGLTLLQQDQAEGASQVRPDFRITLRGRDYDKVGMFAGSIQTEVLNSDATQRGNSYLSFSGDVAPPCAGARPIDADAEATICTDPRGVGASLLTQLRALMFPPDPSLRRTLLDRLANRSTDAGVRLQALSSLQTFGNFQRLGDSRPNEALRDPAVVRAAIDLGTTAADPTQRARVWGLLRGVSNAELARPLLTALREDRDGEVRLAALGTLVAGFREDDGFRPALEVAAQRDARPLVRVLARRVLDGNAGEAAWRDYIADSLKDAKRPAVERIEALFYQLGLPMTAAYISGTRDVPQSTLQQLDGAALQALAGALTEAAETSPVVQRYVSMLWSDLGQIDHPAITDTLLASLNDGGHGLDRVAVANTLGQLPGRRDDPRVRAALEKLASDPDPRMRQVATKALQQQPVPVAAAPPTGAGRRFLGIGLGTVEAESFASKELVGKTLIASVGSGTVAGKAGMLAGDVLLEINGTPLQSPTAIPEILASIPADVEFELLVNRSGENLKLKARF